MLIHNNYKFRAIAIFLIFILSYALILANLYRIQIVKSDFFKNLGEKQYKVTITKYPERGLILDRNSKIIALNKESYSAFIMPNKIDFKKNTKLKSFLKDNFLINQDKLSHNQNKYFMYVKRKISESDKILIDQHNIQEIQFIKEPSRFYPYKHNANIVGITDIDNQGLFGVELIFNKKLSGEPSTYSVEKDARSKTFYFEKETTKSGVDSVNIKLTIDSDLQFLVYQELKNSVKQLQSKEGYAMIINPQNGHVLAMANYPSFNPSKNNNLDINRTKNMCITESHELGSVMKIVVAIAALEEGVVTLDELIDCENTKKTSINGMSFTTVHPDGLIPFSKVVENSNNIGMVKVAMRMGSKLADYYTKLGFGKKTGIELPGEHDGFVNPANRWSKRSIVSFSFGYEVSATIAQLAKMFAAIANNGIEVQPTIMFDKKNNNGKKIISDNTLLQIKDILKNTVEQGTARRALVKGYNIMGKTGTATMLIDGKYSEDHNLYTFAGIVEKDNYKRVIVTFVKDTNLKNVHASNITAPLFARITEKMLIHDRVL